MNVVIRKNRNYGHSSETKKIPSAPRFNRVWGEWGRVEKQNSIDNTVDVRLDSGVYLNRVPVASKEWVLFGESVEKDFNSGERDLPPIQSRIFIMMPSLTYDDCFIAPFSGFNTTDRNASDPFLETEQENIKERITPSGWHITDDYVTGSHKAVSPDEKTSLEIDYGNEEEKKEDNPELHLNLFNEIKSNVVLGDEPIADLSVFGGEIELTHKKGDSCTLKIFDTELVIKKGAVSIKPKETTIEVDGNATIKTSGNTGIEATGDVSVKGVNINVEASGNANMKGANVTVDATTLLTLKTGDAAPFMPNIVPVCPLGFNHGGKPAGIVKLGGA